METTTKTPEQIEQSIKDFQARVIEAMRDAAALKTPKGLKAPSGHLYTYKVWFMPSRGMFLWADLHYIDGAKAFEPMIADGRLVYDGFDLHQDEYMLKYSLGAKVPKLDTKSQRYKDLLAESNGKWVNKNNSDPLAF